MWARAHALLGLTSAQAYYLFAETPEATNIARAFELAAGELDDIKHLCDWTKAGPGVIKPAHLHPDKPCPTFNEFWTSNQYFDDDEPDPNGEDTHYAEYVMCRAAIMAAALRIIVARNAANTPRPGTPKAH